MDLDDDELKYTKILNGTSKQKIKEYSIEKYGKDLYYSDTDSIHCGLSLEDFEICVENYLSNSKNFDELQKIYIKLTNKIDDLVYKRQNELDKGW